MNDIYEQLTLSREERLERACRDAYEWFLYGPDTAVNRAGITKKLEDALNV